jgi:hypothetical protein
MSENECDDSRAIELYRVAARERSSPARDATILQYARTRARRASLFRRAVVPMAAAATVAMALFAWHAYRGNDREMAAARARYSTAARDYLLAMKVADTSAPSAITRYLLDLQRAGPSGSPAQTSQ